MNKTTKKITTKVVRKTSRKTKKSTKKTTLKKIRTFEDGFHLMMSSSIEYERLRRQGKKIPEELNQRMKQWSNWVDNLSQDEYDRLIH